MEYTKLMIAEGNDIQKQAGTGGGKRGVSVYMRECSELFLHLQISNILLHF